jgi:hypothetical protein
MVAPLSLQTVLFGLGVALLVAAGVVLAGQRRYR